MPREWGPVAQRLEQWTHNPLVAGSNPAGPTNYTCVILPQPPASLLFELSTFGLTSTVPHEATEDPKAERWKRSRYVAAVVKYVCPSMLFVLVCLTVST